jgi:Trk K+ transport system NAD-binding subunit
MGCGRVGSGLAIDLEAAGHSVSIIDQNKDIFKIEDIKRSRSFEKTN